MDVPLPGLHHQDVDPRANAAATSVLSACIAVHRALGPGLSEPLYHEALAVELDSAGIPCESKPRWRVRYREKWLSKSIEPDFLVTKSCQSS